MLKRIAISTLFVFLSFHAASADSARISQIDSSKLLLNQDIKLYVSVTDDTGEPISKLSADAFNIYESHNGKDFVQIPKLENFETMTNYESGINFLLLIDNSGSMYRKMNGKRTKNKNARRIAHAKRAVISFLRSITNPKDTVGLVSYNSYYNSHSNLTDDKIRIEGSLDEINRPKREEAYTEIYSSLFLAVDEFRTTRGRKAILILSDGKNQPYYRHTRKEHKIFGNKTFKYSEPTKYCQEEGISVFAINFGKKGDKKDKGLYKIAMQTGGAVFDAHNHEELSKVYSKIVNQILNEYLITYPATMVPADKKFIKVECDTGAGKNSATRFYFSSTVFGVPLDCFTPLLLLPLLLVFASLWFLSKIDFEKKKSAPSIEVLNPGAAKTSTKLFTLGSGKTVIGGDQNADMTIFGGVSKVKEKHATIIFDEKTKQYTVVGEGNLSVNNKSVSSKRTLESGDVINIGGTTIVFDDGVVD